MKTELPHFYIEDSYGGNQDWFPTFMMRIGGCGAETACDCSIYFALHRGYSAIAPQTVGSLTKDEYIQFAYEMKPYLSPRMMGINRTEIFMDGYDHYLCDRGETRITMHSLDGSASFEEARAAVTGQIDHGFPIPTLILNHRNKAFDDYVWHWFLINGYDSAEERFLVKAVTYSHYHWLDLRQLWDTGHETRGGLVLFREEKPLLSL